MPIVRLGNIRQIILYVKDMQKQVEFYRDILGLSISYPIKEDYSTEDWVAFATGECTLALHSGGDGNIGKDAPRFTFEIANVEEARDYLIDNNVEVTTPVEAYPGSYVFAGRDVEGNYFYLQSHPSQN